MQQIKVTYIKPELVVECLVHVPWLSYVKSNLKFWNDNLYEEQLLTGWEDFRAMVKIVYGVGSAHNKATYVTLHLKAKFPRL